MALRKKKRQEGLKLHAGMSFQIVFKLFAIFIAIQGLNFIIWDKLTIQKDPKIMFRKSLERRRVYHNCCCLHFCFLRTWSWKAPGKTYGAGKRCPLWCQGKCQSGSSTVAWLWSWWIPCQPPESALAPGMTIAQRRLDDKECPAASSGISLLWSCSSIYSKKKHISKEDCAKYL